MLKNFLAIVTPSRVAQVSYPPAVADFLRKAPLRELLVLTALMLILGCNQRNRQAYQFELTPRPVIARAGLSPSRNARVAADWISSPTIHMLALVGETDKTRLALLNSEDGGDNFGPPVWVSEDGKPVNSGGENSPAFVATPNEIYAAWNEGGDLRFARSLSWGQSFEKPIKIADKTGVSFSGYPSIGVAPNQDVYVVWIDTRDQVGNSDDNYAVYMARSTDHGASFEMNVRVASKICPCCRPTLAFGPQGEVMVFWRHIYPGRIRDMTVAVTSDGGRTFSSPQRVAADDWKIDGCPDSGPAVAHNGNRVYVAWLTEAFPEISGVRLTWSYDGGKTWAPAVIGSQDILDANYPAMSASNDGHVALVFQGRDPQKQAGWEHVGIFLVDIGPDGKLSPPKALPGITSSASRPTVASGTGGRVYIVWTGTNDGNQSVVLSRARRELR